MLALILPEWRVNWNLSKYGCSGKRTKTNERLVSDALKDFQIYYLSRNESQGGGIAIGVIKD